jgi:hypothetical protein
MVVEEESKVERAMSTFMGTVDKARGENSKAVTSSELFSKDSLPPYERLVSVNLFEPHGEGPPLAAGVYIIPAKSGLGKTTAAIAMAVDITLSKLANAKKADKLREFLGRTRGAITSKEYEALVLELIRMKTNFMKHVVWLSVNEPSTARISVEDLLLNLPTFEEPVIILDSVNDLLEEYSRGFRDPFRSGGWSFSQVEFIAALNAFAEANNKLLLVTLNTDFFPLESMLGRTEGEVYPNIVSNNIKIQARKYGRVEYTRNLHFQFAVARYILDITTDTSKVSKVIHSGPTAFNPPSTLDIS